MESVGPVETGDSGPLPEFSRNEQGAGSFRIVAMPESNEAYPHCHQPADNVLSMSTNAPVEDSLRGRNPLPNFSAGLSRGLCLCLSTTPDWIPPEAIFPT